MPKKATPIQLTESEVHHLESIVQKGTIEARMYRRAKILLLKGKGISNGAIADKLDITVPTVRLCLRKYNESGLRSALGDFSGRVRKAEIFDDSKETLIKSMFCYPYTVKYGIM